MTPFQRFLKIKPMLDHIRVFGNSVFIFIVEDKQDKLQPKAKIGQFVGYDEKIRILLLGA